MPGKGGDVPADMLPVHGVGLAVVVPPAEMPPQAVCVHGLNLRIFRDDPGRRGGGGGAQHRADAVPRQKRNGVVQPAEPEPPFSGSSRLQENSAMRTTCTPSSSIRRASVSQRSRGQCSG